MDSTELKKVKCKGSARTGRGGPEVDTGGMNPTEYFT
jgi:hypothetical protein